MGLLLIGGMACQQAQAQNIDTLDTGAGQDSLNYIAGGNVEPNPLTDPNWTVSLLAVPPVGAGATGGPGPGGTPTGTTYLVPWDIGFPYPHWIGSDGISSWLTYADPQNPNGWFVGGDTTGDTYQYQLTFTALNTGTVNVQFATDNESMLYLNNVLIASSPLTGSYAVWTPGTLSLTAGDTYTVDLDVVNDVGYNEDPTGARVEFSGDVNVVSAVPEPSSTSLMCLGLAGLLTFRRRAINFLHGAKAIGF
jgi:hypothetical protein